MLPVKCNTVGYKWDIIFCMFLLIDYDGLVFLREGEVVAWGINDFGQLGDGGTSYSTSPVKVIGLESVPIADISAGGWHSLALTDQGGEEKNFHDLTFVAHL